MVVEAKRRDLDQGVAQCAVQLDCTGNLNRKSKREDPRKLEDLLLPERLFSFITTRNVWILLHLDSKPTGETIINVHRKAPLYVTNLKDKSKLQEELSRLFGYLLAVFSHGWQYTPTKRIKTGNKVFFFSLFGVGFR
ncbi:hypothetical protein BDZ91DRAFT_399539 [Kalaharituber pfeilii]|nr:hypothetical protein BDZ91DRAFT_399539 [Kalaharituber pfeilii]